MRRLYLDCSHLHRAPAMNTGIERVVRRVADEALTRQDLDVRLAVLDGAGVFRLLERVPALTDLPSAPAGDAIVFEPGDVYFVLSSSWGMGLLERLAPFRRMGVLVGVLFHDLLPLSVPEVFDAKHVVAPFAAWVDACARHADFFACVSRATETDLARELSSRGHAAPVVFTFRPGSDAVAMPEARATADHPVLAAALAAGPTFLTVATIEPRKNHATVLDAFERLWAGGSTARWCVVGKPGTGARRVLERFEHHPERGARLFVCNGVDDADLAVAYREAFALVYPSIAEGFGLPIVEALRAGMPVLASDIPVFHEVAGDHARYFDTRSAEAIATMLDDVASGRLPLPRATAPDTIRVVDWKESAAELLEGISAVESTARARTAGSLRTDRRVDRMRREAMPPVDTTSLRGRARVAWRSVRARLGPIFVMARKARAKLRRVRSRVIAREPA